MHGSVQPRPWLAERMSSGTWKPCAPAPRTPLPLPHGTCMDACVMKAFTAAVWLSSHAVPTGHRASPAVSVTCMRVPAQALTDLVVLQIKREAEKATPSVATLHGSSSKARQLLLVTDWVHEAARNLVDTAGAVLTVAGQLYPPASALRKATLAEFCERMQARANEVGQETTGQQP